MDYEKKYNKLVEAIKVLQETNPSDEGIQNWVNDNVPELAESEDEKIKKWIIDDIRYNMNNEPLNNSEYKKKAEKAIAWLEKQNEFKNIDSDDLATLKTWEDAIKENKEKWQLSDWFVEATSLLIQKVKRIENNPNKKPQRIISAEVKEAMYDKPAWSEEDETVLNNLIYALANDRIGNNRDEYVDWLKSLKGRFTWKPSDEQIEILDMVLSNESMDDNVARILRELREQLKKLREDKL